MQPIFGEAKGTKKQGKSQINLDISDVVYQMFIKNSKKGTIFFVK